MGGNLRIDCFLAASQMFELSKFFSHSGKNELLKIRLAESAAPCTAFVIETLGTAEVVTARRAMCYL